MSYRCSVCDVKVPHGQQRLGHRGHHPAYHHRRGRVLVSFASRLRTGCEPDAAGHERGRDAHLQSLAILVVTLAVTSGALALEHHQWPQASTLWDTVTVTVGNAIATVIRFVVFRRIFAARD